MGCYDTVLVPCPKCGTKAEFQSKGGDCLLRTFELADCPADVMDDVNRHSPHKCEQCGTTFSVTFEIKPGVPDTVVKAVSAVDTGLKKDPMQLIMNPIVALVHNQKLNRWHTIVYRESPLPGPDSPDKPMRHKSVGHHTEGFPTRDEAVADAQAMAKKIVAEGLWTTCKLALGDDLAWDGEDVPADVAFFAPNPDGTMKRVL